jgi:hypothetical protein
MAVPLPGMVAEDQNEVSGMKFCADNLLDDGIVNKGGVACQKRTGFSLEPSHLKGLAFPLSFWPVI